MKNWFVLATLAFALFLGGCGGGVREEKTDVIQISPIDIIKLTIEGVAKTGEDLGSGEESLLEAIEALRETDAAKATTLSNEYEKVSKASDPASRKAAAKSLLTKL